MVRKYAVDKNEDEMEQFLSDMKEAENHVDKYIDAIEASGKDVALEIYKCGLAFARLAVRNNVVVGNFINTSLAIYHNMGGKIEDEKVKQDNLSPRETVH